MYKGIVKVYRENDSPPEQATRRLTQQELPKKEKQGGILMEVTVTSKTLPGLVNKISAMMNTLDEDD